MRVVGAAERKDPSAPQLGHALVNLHPWLGELHRWVWVRMKVRVRVKKIRLRVKIRVMRAWE